MTRPDFQILTQQELVIDLSRPAMEHVLDALAYCDFLPPAHVKGEVDNFRNILHNLLERSEPEHQNLDLIGGD
jgi:hypothetical protein